MPPSWLCPEFAPALFFSSVRSLSNRARSRNLYPRDSAVCDQSPHLSQACCRNAAPAANRNFQADRSSDPLDLHLVVDNYATHKTRTVKRWHRVHPRFHLHFTPTSASWLNMAGDPSEKITSRPTCLHADICVDATRNRLIAIKEERPNGDVINAINSLVAVDIQTGSETILDAAYDFYSSPALSADGSRLAWLSFGPFLTKLPRSVGGD
jgi:hypothetical protein